ncbi:NADH-ubiquinone reductase complex 1 MLRQ subunit-domain-containing protein [Lobosporangium transversale]|uniref:NADH-ubiquinone reductase complex 1 MLRQ subunit-domain-containing protein n=1 Tax=Lobosporangium transversale TaxID=64571 RepID=A0A1Y2GEZ3_9FUNG|nr:NADH-ubiquinone reductase complex 1 MLRQ subunit-domain-containing protein [Lobosporangium transversale]ORZ09026.1 NADH-ubiquinone reductase complex 1 MLRQ subunit-domain-containing protein [Lobosporangium transversale]|eukprot:XP_021878653.1 NADH-ubiquinone reductase complex 1 MLRQ subunit-domain-containing protein [Lobosporangium transversale]
MSAAAAAQAAKKAPSVFKTWFVVEAIPIYAVLGAALGGAGWYVTRLARGPDVTWDRKNNPHPWLHIDQQTQLKLMTVKEGQGFTKSYSRDRL